MLLHYPNRKVLLFLEQKEYSIPLHLCGYNLLNAFIISPLLFILESLQFDFRVMIDLFSLSKRVNHIKFFILITLKCMIKKIHHVKFNEHQNT